MLNYADGNNFNFKIMNPESISDGLYSLYEVTVIALYCLGC